MLIKIYRKNTHIGLMYICTFKQDVDRVYASGEQSFAKDGEWRAIDKYDCVDPRPVECASCDLEGCWECHFLEERPDYTLAQLKERYSGGDFVLVFEKEAMDD
jgi:hypothetical protein